MAMLLTKDRRPIFVTAEQGNLLWLVKTGERRGSADVRKKLENIERIYLNPATAPASYREAHPTIPDKAPEPAQVRLPYVD